MKLIFQKKCLAGNWQHFTSSNIISSKKKKTIGLAAKQFSPKNNLTKTILFQSMISSS